MAGADDLRPLDAAIDEIRILHEAAERVAARIDEEASRFVDPGDGTGPMVANVAEALVGRTEAIRADCERLETLLQRARAALGANAGAPAAPSPRRDTSYGEEPPHREEPLHPAGPPRPPEPAFAVDPPFVAPESAPAPGDRPSWRFWRRGRGRDREEAPGQSPPPLPRPDWTATGIGPVAERPDQRATTRQPIPEGVRLIATQMAIAGSDRIEIARRLERQFGVSDPEAALDEVFGYGSITPSG